ncbi:MAG: YggT family protein [Anaerolineaceae bacterium]|nr:YggT family protein [Anaerolineaceae bacterium]
MVASIIQLIFQLLTFVIFADVLLSFFMSPYHPIRKTLDSIVNPMLEPIRKIVPPVQGIDFSPMVLLILVQILEYILLRVI